MVPAPLFAPHTTHDRVPTVQRAAVVVLHKQGRTRAEIGQQAGVSQPTPRTLKRRLELEDISARTIARRLDEAGLHGRMARHTFELTADHKRKRLSFAEGYQRWSDDDWD